MKKTQEMIGLPIISISDGMEVGKVKSILVNADKGAIDYIVVDSGIQILGARVIPTEYIQGIGEYALTIENESAINDISKIPAAIDLLQKNILVRGTKVLTTKGRLIGEIEDFYVDENDSCRITALEYIADITQKKVRLIPRKNVITFGKNLIIVTDDVESCLVDNISQLTSSEGGEEEKKNIIDFSIEDSEAVSENSSADVRSSEGESTAANLFEQRQRQYLIGRKATRTITGINGEIIVAEGDVINEEIIDAAKANGKLVELVMNNRP